LGAGFPTISELKKLPILMKNPANATVIANLSSSQNGFFFKTFMAKNMVEHTKTMAAP
jgi:hypothetical protein